LIQIFYFVLLVDCRTSDWNGQAFAFVLGRPADQ
jgi:hypothetical protein